MFLLSAPLTTRAALYAPGATLDPACAPTDANCGIASQIGSGTIGQVPYYAAAGTSLTATSTFTILANGNTGIGTTTPYALFSVNGKAGGASDIFAVATSSAGYATTTALRIDSSGNLYLPGGNGLNIGYGTTAPPSNGIIVAGKFGIGTSSPFTNLSVSGNAYITGTATVADFITQITPVYDVRAYGSLQSAIDTASAAGGGTVQPAPNTTYTGAITLKANVTLRCVDRSTVLTIPNGANTGVVTVSGSNTAVVNCTIDGNKSNQTTSGNGIGSFADISNITIDNIELRNTFNSGLRLRGATGAVSNVTVRNSYIHDVGDYGLYFEGVTNLKVQNNLVKVFATRTTLADAFFLTGGSGNSYNTNVSIIGNVVQNTVSTFFGIESVAGVGANQGVNGCTISDNTFDAGGLNASGISGAFFNCSMTGNVHQNGAGGHRSGYEIVGTGDSISGNTILNGTIVFGEGSSNDTSTDIVISNNYIRNDSANGVGDASGIMVGGGTIPITDVSITGNKILLTNATPQSAVYLGVFGTQQQINRIKVTGNEIYCSAGGGNGIRLLALSGTSGVDVEANSVTGCGNGWVDDSSVGNYTDISLINNYLYGNTTAISHNFTGGSWRNWGNITTAGQTTQNLNGGATVSSTGLGTFNGGLLTSGLVGIGTTSPYRALSVAGSGVFTGGDVLASTLTATSSITASSLSLTAALTVPNGGTGATTLTGLLQGNGTSAITAITGSTGQFPYYNGTNTLAATSSIFLATSGNVGVGTTSPSQKLDVWGNVITNDGSTPGKVLVGAVSNFPGIWFGTNTVTPSVTNYGFLRDAGTATILNAPTGEAFAFRINNSNKMWIDGTTGNVGIGTTSPWRTLSVAGTVALSGLTTDSADSKTLCLTAGGEVVANAGTSCITSSERFKNTIEPLATSSGLDEVLQLNPVSFAYNADIGIPGTQVGFIAEQVNQIDPRLVVLDASSTPFTVRYENLTAVLAKAIQEIASIGGTFQKNMIAWLGSAGNGITDFFATTVHTQNLCVKRSDGSEICITGDQLNSVLNQSGQQGAAAPAAAFSAPIIITDIPAPAAEAASSTDHAATSTPQAAPTSDAATTTEAAPSTEASAAAPPGTNDPTPSSSSPDSTSSTASDATVTTTTPAAAPASAAGNGATSDAAGGTSSGGI